MKKYLLPGMIILAFLFSCKTKNTKRHYQSKTTETKEDSIQLDTTTITSLKSLKAAPLNEALSQLWKMDDVSQKYWNYLMWDSGVDKRKYPELALYKDFSATENARCKIRMGKWKINKESRELLLNFTDGSNEKYFVKKILLQKIVLTKKINDEDVDITFISDGLAQKNLTKDPFYPANNLWRIKPKQSETDEQILWRVKQCVHFYSLFFSDNHRRAATEIAFDGLPNCFQWYNGGIGVPQELDLDKKWMDCFYSEKEALRGYHLLRILIEKHVLVWPENPTSWIQETHEMLDQIYDKL
ncbi:MAG TPA: hypothetical protein VKT28_18505 [Puia sp.]|nr:hypothetical protein [Puia sp.]